jgi:hypothetical protein
VTTKTEISCSPDDFEGWSMESLLLSYKNLSFDHIKRFNAYVGLKTRIELLEAENESIRMKHNLAVHFLGIAEVRLAAIDKLFKQNGCIGEIQN